MLISYTNKAAAELTDRMDIQGLRGYTFHKLALDIIAREQKAKPSICDNTDSLFVSIFHQLLEDEKFKQAILVYFIDYQVQETDEEKRLKQKRQKLASMKDNRIKAVMPDMDGKPVYVRSEEEKKLCFVLSSLGLKFRYEEAYEHQVLDEYYSQYRPDFSIHYEKMAFRSDSTWRILEWTSTVWFPCGLLKAKAFHTRNAISDMAMGSPGKENSTESLVPRS